METREREKRKWIEEARIKLKSEQENGGISAETRVITSVGIRAAIRTRTETVSFSNPFPSPED